MLSLNRALKLRDLEVFRVLKDGNILSYIIIEEYSKAIYRRRQKIRTIMLYGRRRY